MFIKDDELDCLEGRETVLEGPRRQFVPPAVQAIVDYTKVAHLLCTNLLLHKAFLFLKLF